VVKSLYVLIYAAANVVNRIQVRPCRAAAVARAIPPRFAASGDGESYALRHGGGKGSRRFDTFEATHRPRPLFNAAMVLFQTVVQVAVGAMAYPFPQLSLQSLTRSRNRACLS